MITDKYMIREQNKALVLEYIIKEKLISRATIAQLTGLNKATVSEITKQLLECCLIEEIGVGESSNIGGRKPILLQLKKESGFSLSIDVGYNYISSFLTYLNGEITAAYKQKNIYINKDNVVSFIKEIVLKYSEYVSSEKYRIIGLTIAIHGIIDNETIVFTPYYDLDQIDLLNILKDTFDFPVFLENEANLTALAEHTFSSDSSNIVSLSIHSGIGAGVIINNELYKGHNGQAGEIGHSILVPYGKECPCGNKGCLEQYCSEKAILEKYDAMTGKNNSSPDDIADSFHSLEPEAVECLTIMTEYLSFCINNIITNFSPEVIFITSPIFRRIPELSQMIEKNMIGKFNRYISVKNSKLGSKSVLYGGTVINIKNFLGIKNLNLKGSKL